MNNEQQQIIDEAYENYSYSCIRETKKQEHEMKEKGGWLTLCLTPFFENKKEFINKCKTDNEFSVKWGLKIEERELSLDERKKLYEIDYTDGTEIYNDYWLESKLATRNIPTKLTTITYNNKTIESYE